MKNKISKNNIDSIDKILYDLAKKDYTVIPSETHNNIIETLENLEEKARPCHRSRIKKIKSFSFQKKFGTVVTNPYKIFAITLLFIVLLYTSIVGARNMSDKFFNKDTLRLNDIGIANEFIFTPELEIALKQNVPLNYVELNDNYFLSVHSLLINEVYFFTVFELHSKSGVTDDLRFAIRDLVVTDENGNCLACSCDEVNTTKNSGYHHIYNKDNSIRELFFIFGNDNSKVKELNYYFSNIKIYRYTKEKNNEFDFPDIDVAFEAKNINISITKDNYNTIQEYTFKNNSDNETYKLQKAIYTNTGLHVIAENKLEAPNPLIQIDNNVYAPTYKLPLKRVALDKTLMLYEYDISNISRKEITLYNETNKEKYTLVPQM